MNGLLGRRWINDLWRRAAAKLVEVAETGEKLVAEMAVGKKEVFGATGATEKLGREAGLH